MAKTTASTALASEQKHDSNSPGLRSFGRAEILKDRRPGEVGLAEGAVAEKIGVEKGAQATVIGADAILLGQLRRQIRPGHSGK
jgi:hypothetical protein